VKEESMSEDQLDSRIQKLLHRRIDAVFGSESGKGNIPTDEHGCYIPFDVFTSNDYHSIRKGGK
jgi:hypothetical protein